MDDNDDSRRPISLGRLDLLRPDHEPSSLPKAISDASRTAQGWQAACIDPGKLESFNPDSSSSAGWKYATGRAIHNRSVGGLALHIGWDNLLAYAWLSLRRLAMMCLFIRLAFQIRKTGMWPETDRLMRKIVALDE